MSGRPEISVVVPARNAETTVGALLDALNRSTYDRPWEVVFVDDGSTDSTALIAGQHGARVVSLTGQGGPANARNAGVEAAGAPLIAFTDADCEPSPGWLAAVAEGLARADLVTGPVLPVEGTPVGPFRRTLRITGQTALFETANLAVRRELVDRIGGFEPFVPKDGGQRGLRPAVADGHFGEDSAFGWRARRLGARIEFVESALVRHAVFPRGPRGWIAERWRLRFFPTLVLEFPEMRQELTLRFFLSKRTALFDLALAGVLLAAIGRRPIGLLGAVPYLRERLTWRRFWRRSIARRNLAFMVGDAVACAALVRGSIAARRGLF